MTQTREPTTSPDAMLPLALEALRRGVRGRAALIEYVSAGLDAPLSIKTLFSLCALSERLLDDPRLTRTASASASRARRDAGVYYTPPQLVRRVIREAIPESPLRDDFRICDPSCGSGAFLIGAVERLTTLGQSSPIAVSMLRGIELDATSASITMRLLSHIAPVEPSALLIGDALVEAGDAWNGACDVVIGNPPFVDSETLCRLQPDWREAVARQYHSARGNWDLSCVFIERALRLLRPGGRLAMVVPARLLAADYAASLHTLLLHEFHLEAILDGGKAPFAGVQMPVAILSASRCRARSPVRVEWAGTKRFVTAAQLHALPAGQWSAITASPAQEAWLEALTKRAEHFAPLESMCEHLGDGMTTAEAYTLAPLLREWREDDADSAIFRIANTGTIDPWRFLWGVRPMRFLGRELLRPVIERETLHRALPRRAAQAQRPKVLLAGLSRRIEAVVDPDGGWLCGKSAFQAIPNADLDPWTLAAMLNTSAATEIASILFSLRGLGRVGSSLCLGARQWRRLPMPVTLLHDSRIAEMGQCYAKITLVGGYQEQFKFRLEDMMREAAGISDQKE